MSFYIPLAPEEDTRITPPASPSDFLLKHVRDRQGRRTTTLLTPGFLRLSPESEASRSSSQSSSNSKKRTRPEDGNSEGHSDEEDRDRDRAKRQRTDCAPFKDGMNPEEQHQNNHSIPDFFLESFGQELSPVSRIYPSSRRVCTNLRL